LIHKSGNDRIPDALALAKLFHRTTFHAVSHEERPHWEALLKHAMYGGQSEIFDRRIFRKT
jgi:hypothetical protein